MRRLDSIRQTILHDKLDPSVRQLISDQIYPVLEVLAVRSGKPPGLVEQRLRSALEACPKVPRPAGLRCRSTIHQLLADLFAFSLAFARAVPHYEAVIELWRASDEAGLINARSTIASASARLAVAHLVLGNATRAREILEAMLTEFDFFALDDSAPDAYFALARALIQTKGDRDRAIAFARKARTQYEALGAGKAPDIRAVDAWLRSIGAR
jgi:tetratricopeptide (TPR) repeat protein